MYNYAQESKRKFGRNRAKSDVPQSERKASQATHSQSGKQEATAFRAEISLAPVQFVGQYFAMEL